jgi:hypothetical protein
VATLIVCLKAGVALLVSAGTMLRRWDTGHLQVRFGPFLSDCIAAGLRRDGSGPTFSQPVLTTYQTTFCEVPFPHTFPVLTTARNILPSVTPAALVY